MHLLWLHLRYFSFRPDPGLDAAVRGVLSAEISVRLCRVVVVQRDGVTIGAAALSGGMPDVDHDIMVKAVEAVGLSVIA